MFAGENGQIGIFVSTPTEAAASVIAVPFTTCCAAAMLFDAKARGIAPALRITGSIRCAGTTPE